MEVKLTRADVARARQAFHAVADTPEWERIARATYGDAEVDAVQSAARPAAKIAAIWAKMDPAERGEFHRVLAAQVGETPDTLPVDVGAAAREIVDAARGRPGNPPDFPGLREAVASLLASWESRGGAVEVGRLYTTDGPGYMDGKPPMRPTSTVRFVAAGVLRAIPEHYRMMEWPDAKRRLLHDCWRQVQSIHKAQ